MRNDKIWKILLPSVKDILDKYVAKIVIPNKEDVAEMLKM